MSIVSVCHLVPNPVSTLYRFACTSNQAALERDSQHQEGRMSFHSGVAPLSAGNSGEPLNSDQREHSIKVEKNERLSAHLAGQNDTIQSRKTLHPEIKTEDGQVFQQQTPQGWHQGENNISATESVHDEHEPSDFKRETDEDPAENLSNDEDVTDGPAMSATADKKKSKRFRLTHNQTRFLMSEFTRQAHPDAAQREKLSREIPGLSPRQVQVWFQNRRAKLKRLTSHDRDRILKSRALPENFDRTQMLHHPYNPRPVSDPSSRSAQPSRSSFASSCSKPLAVNTVKTASTDKYSISPASATAPAYGNYTNSPASAGLSESMSPTSNTGNGMAIPGTGVSFPGFPGIQQSHSHSYARAHSFSTSYNGWQQFHTQRMHMPPPDSGIKPDAMNTVLRPGSAYQELGGSISDASSYGRHSSLASSARDGVQNDGPLQPGLTYQGQSHNVQNEPYPASTQAIAASHSSFSPVGFRQVPPLQTSHLPPPQDYQISPFTPSFNYDSFYQYAHDNTSAVSLPNSFIRSETSYDSPIGYSYENDMSKFTPHREDAR